MVFGQLSQVESSWVCVLYASGKRIWNAKCIKWSSMQTNKEQDKAEVHLAGYCWKAVAPNQPDKLLMQNSKLYGLWLKQLATRFS